MRVKRFYATTVFLKALLAPGNIICEAVVVSDGWPEDARIVRASFDALTDSVLIIVASETFAEVEDESKAAMLTTTFEPTSAVKY